MAIRAPEYITADPAGAWAKTFNQADASARDYARLQLEQKRMAENAVQQARENKANDFKLMLAAINQEGEAEDRVLRREQQGIANKLARFNADTSRMSAEASRDRISTARRANGDPLGLGGTTSAVPSDMSVPDTDLEDPLAPVSPDAAYGEGIDADVSSRDNAALRQLEMDNATWASGGTPASALPQTPLIDTAGPDAPPDLTTPADAVVVPDAELQGPPALDMTGLAPAPVAPVPQSVPAADAQLLPPPMLTVPSFSEADISQKARNDLYDLYRVNAGLTAKSALDKQSATRTAAAIKSVTDPVLRQKYQERLAGELASAESSAAQANEAKIKAIETGKKAAVMQKRQDELSALSHLDGVLPESDRQKLMTEAADLRSGGAADQKITVLKAYDQTRQTHGLEHRSNGLKTAEQVARTGLALATPEANKDREESQKAEVYRKLIEANSKRPAGEQDDEDTVTEWKKQLNANLAGDVQWKQREAQFKKAVRDDTFVPPTAEEIEVPVEAVTLPKTTAPLPPVSVNPDAPMANTPESWTAVKAKFRQENPKLIERLRQVAISKPTFSEPELANILFEAFPDGGREAAQGTDVAYIERPRASNRIPRMMVAKALVEDLRKETNAPVVKTPGWTVVKKAPQ